MEKTKSVLSKLEQLTLKEVPAEVSPEGEPVGSTSKPPRTRVRTRKNKHKDVEDVDLPKITVLSSTDSASDPIDYSMQFVLDMVRLPQSEWFQFVKETAIRKGVFCLESGSDKDKPKYVWNNRHAANEHTATLMECVNNSTYTPAVPKRDKKKRRFLNLDETINFLITDPDLHVSLSPHKYRSEMELDRAMKQLAAKLINAGLGYEDEGELFVTKQGKTAFVRTNPEVVIRQSKLRRCALNGDIVRVFVFNDPTAAAAVLDEIAQLSGAESGDDEEELAIEDVPKSGATGFIIRIVKQVHDRLCVGQFGGSPSSRSKNFIFYPHERGVPPVNVSAKHLDKFVPKEKEDVDLFFQNLPQRIYEVELTTANSFYCVYNGKVVADIGLKGNIMDENSCILRRHGFKKNCIDRLEQFGETDAEEEIGEDEKDRRDLTKMCIFTIDPATARDLDDAVSCRQLDNGNVEVGIHISDVTFYVPEDSTLDAMVRQAKTTSVYMVDQVYHMLPTDLCQTCSLLPGARKRAISVFVEMTQNAEVVSTSYTRSLINSCCQLSYEQAQKIIDDEDPLSVAPVTIYNEFSAADLRNTIKTLHGLSRIMRDRRMQNGALKFDKPKYYFRLNADNEPVELFSEMSKPANHLIEEFMILANEVVGEHIYQQYPEWAILRQHSPPKMDQMAKVRVFFKELGFPELLYRTAKDINASMEAILAEADRRQLDKKGFELVLNGLLAKPMNRAQYFCTGDSRYDDRFEHFALSIPFYTHFTSPIRRYPDILVHRLLIRAIHKLPGPTNWFLTEINDLMGECNRQKMNARYASEDSARLFLIHYLRKNFPEGREMTATVCNVLQRSIEVKLWETGDELNIAHTALVESGFLICRSDEDGVHLKKTEGGQELSLKIFTTCKVLVRVEQDYLKATLLA